MTVGALIIARLSSTRLPNKNILEISGKPMIIQLADRVSKSKKVDKVIIATSNLPSDDPLEELAKRYDILCHRGSLENVMERIVGAAEEFDCETIVEILGDNPLVHSDLIDDVIDLHESYKADYTANITTEYDPYCENMSLFSVGLRVQVYSLNAAREYIKFPEYESNDRHPSAFMFDNPEIFKISFLEAKGKWKFMNRPRLNFAVNYRKNFKLIEKIFKQQYQNNPNFNLADVYDQLDKDVSLYSLFGPE